jgi:hypothetical protein
MLYPPELVQRFHVVYVAYVLLLVLSSTDFPYETNSITLATNFNNYYLDKQIPFEIGARSTKKFPSISDNRN